VWGGGGGSKGPKADKTEGFFAKMCGGLGLRVGLGGVVGCRAKRGRGCKGFRGKREYAPGGSKILKDYNAEKSNKQ